MARIRSIHPRIFTDEAFASLTFSARILFIGIWTEAWDDGVFEWKPLSLKMRIFPADSIDIAPLLQELEAVNAVKKVEAEGKIYGLVRNFCKYQRPKKPNSSGVMRDEFRTYVACPFDSSEPVPNQFPTNTENRKQMEDGGWREEEEGNLKAHIVDNPARAFSENPSPPDFENPMACENCNAPTINRDSANLAKIDASATYVAEAAKSHVTAFRSALTENPVLETRKAVCAAYQAAGELPPDTSRIGQWIANGFTPDEIKSCIAAVLQRGTRPKSLKYFDQALVEIRTAPRAPPMQGKPNKPPARGSAAIANALDEIVENGYTHSSSIDQNASLCLSVA